MRTGLADGMYFSDPIVVLVAARPDTTDMVVGHGLCFHNYAMF